MQMNKQDIEEMKAWAQLQVAMGGTFVVEPEKVLALMEHYEARDAEAARIVASLEDEISDGTYDEGYEAGYQAGTEDANLDLE